MMFVPSLGVMLLAILVAGLVVWPGNDGPAQASPGLVVGFDMNPAGNSCPGDGVNDCTLSTIDPCKDVNVSESPATFDIDVFLEGLPAGESILGFGYAINWGPPDALLTVNAQTHTSTTVNLVAQGASPLDLSEGVPDTTSSHLVNMADFGAAEYNPPYTHGVLGRYNVTVPTGTVPGFYGLTLSSVSLGNDTVAPGGPYGTGIDLCGVYGCDIWDANSGPPTMYGLIAVAPSSCAAAPTPTPTGSPTVTSTPATPTPPVTSTPTPTPPGLVAGWNHTCYLGPELPIADALADLGTSLLAVYRPRADQGYDKWFPSRPELSTANMTVNPYQALLILMANSLPWPQEPAGTPPTSLDLEEGWNSACYSGQTKEVEEATASMAGQFGVLYSLAPAEGWKRFVPGRPEISNLSQLQQFAAIFILVSQPGGAHWVFAP
jgi:hypothetical protein